VVCISVSMLGCAYLQNNSGQLAVCKKEFSVMVCMRYISTVPGNVFACLHRSSGIKALLMFALIAEFVR
jgi:hypothetical protein